MAVAIDGGLITPTIIKAQEQDLFSISRTWKELVEKAKSKKLTPAEYNSGTEHYHPKNLLLPFLLFFLLLLPHLFHLLPHLLFNVFFFFMISPRLKKLALC